MHCVIHNINAMVVLINIGLVMTALGCILQVYPVLADLNEILLLARRYCPWQRNPALGKEILLLAKKPCSWQGDLALGKETLLLAKRSCFWQRNPDLGKEILLWVQLLKSNFLVPDSYFSKYFVNIVQLNADSSHVFSNFLAL